MYKILQLRSDRGVESLFSFYTVDEEIMTEVTETIVDELTQESHEETKTVGTGKFEKKIWTGGSLNEVEAVLVELIKTKPVSNLIVIDEIKNKVDFIFDEQKESTPDESHEQI